MANSQHHQTRQTEMIHTKNNIFAINTDYFYCSITSLVLLNPFCAARQISALKEVAAAGLELTTLNKM